MLLLPIQLRRLLLLLLQKFFKLLHGRRLDVCHFSLVLLLQVAQMRFPFLLLLHQQLQQPCMQGSSWGQPAHLAAPATTAAACRQHLLKLLLQLLLQDMQLAGLLQPPRTHSSSTMRGGSRC